MSITLTRTFHPVGQGTFYTEQIENKAGGAKFTVVYDCGSGNTNNCPQSLCDYLDTCIDAYKEIDILFISHFHNDHINGIKSLIGNGVKIKNIVLPYVESGILNGIISLKNEYNDPIFDSHIQNPYETLHSITSTGTRFVYVVSEGSRINGPFLPPDSQSTNPFGDNRPVVSINNNIQTKENICYCHSGDIISLCNWFFAPFVDKKIEGNDDLKDALESLKDLISDLKITYGDDWIANGKSQISEAYKKINNNINKTSMMVFSSPFILRAVMDCRLECKRPDCDATTKGNLLWASCLYTGDIPLDSSICSQITTTLSPYQIGTFQIPHHGSRVGWNPPIKGIGNKINDSINFLSYGIKNRYQHPSKEVLKYFYDKAERVMCVNDDKSTKIIQTIQL